MTDPTTETGRMEDARHHAAISAMAQPAAETWTVLGEEARAALLLAMERVTEREDNPPPGRLAYAALVVLDQFIRSLLTQAREEGERAGRRQQQALDVARGNRIAEAALEHHYDCISDGEPCELGEALRAAGYSTEPRY